MSLRTRLLLGYGYLVVLLLLSAGTAAVGFYDLGKGIDRVLTDDYERVDASMAMIEALAQQEDLILTRLLDRSAPPEPLDEAGLAFDKALARARANATTDEERSLVAHVGRAYGAYVRLRDERLASSAAPSLESYRSVVRPTFQETKGLLGGLLNVSRRAMFAANERSRRVALRNAVLLGTLVVIALLSLVILARRLRRDLLDRLLIIRSCTDAIAAGDHQRRLPDMGTDELGLVVRRLNEGLDAQDRIRRETSGRVNQQRDLILGLLAELAPRAGLFGLDGRALVPPAGAPDAQRDQELAAWLRDKGRAALADAAGRCPAAKANLPAGRLRPLLAGPDRPVAWLWQEVATTHEETPAATRASRREDSAAASDLA